MQNKHNCISPQVDPVDQKGIQDYFYHYLDGKKYFIFYNEIPCIVVSLELFMIVVVKVEKL